MADLERIHAEGVPLTVIDGEAVVGFDKVRLDGLLRSKGVSISQPA